jgi:hypothetical protein
VRRSTWTIVISLVGVLGFGASAMAYEVSIDNLPPSVVKTVPQCGAINVDPNLNEISVVFSKDMLDRAWSFVRISPESFPKLVGKPHFAQDKRTCVVKVALEPDKTYALWLNSESYRNFKDSDQRPAVPYLLVFRTAKGK